MRHGTRQRNCKKKALSNCGASSFDCGEWPDGYYCSPLHSAKRLSGYEWLRKNDSMFFKPAAPGNMIKQITVVVHFHGVYSMCFNQSMVTAPRQKPIDTTPSPVLAFCKQKNRCNRQESTRMLGIVLRRSTVG